MAIEHIDRPDPSNPHGQPGQPELRGPRDADPSAAAEYDASGEVVAFRRKDAPRPAYLEHDVDGDGRPDLIVPGQVPAYGTPPAPQGAHGEAGDLQPAEHDGAGVVPVDQPDPHARTVYATVLAARTAKRRPVFPGWMKNRQKAGDVARWASGHAAHTAAYHGVRLVTVYPARIVARAPRGVSRSLSRVSAWAADAEARPLRLEAVRANKPEEYRKLMDRRDDRVRLRGWIVAICALTAVAVLVTLLLAPRPVQLAALLLGLCLAARAGSDRDQPLIGHAVIGTEVAKLTSATVIRALTSIGLQAMTGKDAAITFPAPITRDGPGWRADIDLPHGVTAEEVTERRIKLASGLRRQTGAVWPEVDHAQHAGRLVLWVGDQPFSKAKQPAWPLARTGQADIFKPLPYGFDQRGRLVSINLMFSNLLCGSIPRQGKTFAVRVLALVASLDPTVELHIGELKGTGDLGGLEPCCHRYASGPGDDATLDLVMASIREVYGYLDTRAGTIKGLPRALCPENKVTPALAADRRHKLWPVLLIVDEVQELFDSEHRDDAERMLTAIIKRGPALGIMLILATQRPDAKSLPAAISSNVGIRLALRVMDQLANDMILGTSSYKAGIRATQLTDDDKGIAILRDGGVTKTVRSAYLDAVQVEKIARRARQIREAHGLITGHAAGDEAPRPEDEDQVLIDVLGVWPAGEDRAWSELLCERLAALDPSRYAGWTPETLAEAVKVRGLSTRQMQFTIDGKRHNRRGLDRAKVAAAVGDRAAGIEPGAPLLAIEAGGQA
jgi:DNA segregation ATPase FtsK/SpoIIIE, S-DNA-T family